MSKGKKDGKKGEKSEKAAGSRFLARVYVSLKPTVNDPEGLTIRGALGSLGFGAVEGVRSGRYFQITLRADSKKTAKTQVEQMCARLLANPVIETYSFDLEEV